VSFNTQTFEAMKQLYCIKPQIFKLGRPYKLLVEPVRVLVENEDERRVLVEALRWLVETVRMSKSPREGYYRL
jgi:hypothetical protein